MTTASCDIFFAPLAFESRSIANAVGRFVSCIPIRNSLLSGAIVLAASVVAYADERLQDWIPSVLVFPEDIEIVADRAVGSTIRLFSISTGADVDVLLADWRESLTEEGYAVMRDANDLADRSIEFDGPGITNAKIIAAPSTEDGRSVIQFDATLD